MRKLAILVLLSAAVMGHAQGVWVSGMGRASCGEYLEDRGKRSQTQDGIYATWAWGYISGFNMEALYPTTTQLPDMPSTLAFLDKHCRENPLDNLINASNALITALGGRRRVRP